MSARPLADVWQERMIALGATVQAAAAVKQVARLGLVREPATSNVLLASVLELNPASVDAMYLNREELRFGLENLLLQVGPSKNKDMEVTRYVVGILALERRLSRSASQMQQLGQRLQQLHRQKYQFNFADDTIIATMAGIYSDLISPLAKPLRINGHPAILQQPSQQNLIRALLLSGVRNAVLWRQLGGRRRHFIWYQSRIVRTVQQLLKELPLPSEPLS